MSESIQTKGKTVNDAVSEALLQLGLRRDEVEIKVLEEPKAGLLGFIGTRAAKVMVRKKPEGRRGRGRGRDHRSNDDQSHSLSGGGRSRGGRSRGGRGRGGRNNQNRNENNNRQDANRAEGGRPDNNRQDNSRQDNNRQDSSRRDNSRRNDNRQNDNRQEAARRDDNRGGRGRGGRGGARNDNRNDNRNHSRNQPRDEAVSRNRDDVRVEPKVESRDENRSAPRSEARNDNRGGNRNDNRNEGRGGSRSRRSRRVNPQQESQDNVNVGPVTQDDQQSQSEQNNESRGTRRGSRGGRGRGRGRDDQHRGDQRRDEATDNNAAAVNPPAAEVVQDNPNTRENTSMTDEQNKPAPVEAPKVEAAAPAPAAEVAQTPAPAPAPAPVAKPKRKGWGGGLGSRLSSKTNPQAQDRKPVRVVGESPEPSAVAPSSSREPRRESRGDSRGRSDYRERRPAAVAEEMIISGVPASKYAKAVDGVTPENLDSALVELTSGMLARAGFPCEVQVNDGEYRQVRISSDDESAGMLIGRHGQTVDAVEHLVERMASNAIDDRARMNLDINEYRLRREESLAERVADAIAEVRETGKAYHVESMDARERRLVHLEAEPVEGIRTYTMVGHGGKHVVIALDDQADEDNRNED